MIPVVDGVFKIANCIITDKDNEKSKARKQELATQKTYIERYDAHIRRKALILYNLKSQGKLYDNYNDITCDFQRLEKAALNYLQDIDNH